MSSKTGSVFVKNSLFSFKFETVQFSVIEHVLVVCQIVLQIFARIMQTNNTSNQNKQEIQNRSFEILKGLMRTQVYIYFTHLAKLKVFRRIKPSQIGIMCSKPQN
ncbi:Hypothetical_protein [Hexamita inflata]|uniref:Hypothetical_protein n=1 Tax=Hexamita inflata TaxID=28002 RepID=A0AA86UHZ0_9EUKA|nr:Hypothetical protein HINF_LOCUS44129 [Hexamita inflata]